MLTQKFRDNIVSELFLCRFPDQPTVEKNFPAAD